MTTLSYTQGRPSISKETVTFGSNKPFIFTGRHCIFPAKRDGKMSRIGISYHPCDLRNGPVRLLDQALRFLQSDGLPIFANRFSINVLKGSFDYGWGSVQYLRNFVINLNPSL